jgi:hypothetical protein
MPAPPSLPDPDKRLQFVSHLRMLYVHADGIGFALRTMHTHELIARAANIYDLRVVGEDYVTDNC